MTNMKYPIAIPFNRFNKLEGKIKEYNILFRTDDSSLEDLIQFITLPFIERVNIQFTNKINIKIIQTVNNIKDCLYVRVMPEHWPQISELQDNKIRFFLDGSMPVSTYTQLAEAFDLGVSDIYIADDLNYNLDDVSKICKEKNIQMRLILNRIPATTLTKGSDVKSPIYRPQDMDILEKYFNVFEFDCDDPYNWNEFNVLFKAFFINKYWHGDLSELNHDIQIDFPNDQIMLNYSFSKMNCGRRCDSRASNKCKKCQQFYDIRTMLLDKGVALL